MDNQASGLMMNRSAYRQQSAQWDTASTTESEGMTVPLWLIFWSNDKLPGQLNNHEEFRG